MGYTAKGIALDEVRASHQRQVLRQKLHACFDQWLDALEAQLPEAEPSLAQGSETIWALRQALPQGVAQTMLEQSHPAERARRSLACATWQRPLTARPTGSRTVDTLIGQVEVQRLSCYCRVCHRGHDPLDACLGLSAGRMQLDVQQAATEWALELPSETASALFGRLRGVSVRSERLHTLSHQVAEGLSVLEVAPGRGEVD